MNITLYCDVSLPRAQPFVKTPFRCKVSETLHGFKKPESNAMVKLVSQQFV
jgi:hypothetical protein